MTPTEPAEQYYDLSKIRTGSRKLFNFVSQGHSKHFQVDQSRLLPTASYIADVIKENYPDLLIPIHSRIRHFPPAYLDLYNADLEAENIEKLRRPFFSARQTDIKKTILFRISSIKTTGLIR